MSLSRRSFLTRSTLAVGGLLVGDAALEAFERLTHRKVFALGGLPEPDADQLYLSNLFRQGDGVALIRSGAIVEFGVVADVRATTITFNTPQDIRANDVLIRANKVRDHYRYYASGPAAQARPTHHNRLTWQDAYS